MTITSSQTGAFTSAPFLLRRRSRFVQSVFMIERIDRSRSPECAARGGPYAARLIRLNYLAPDIVAAILDGKQPVDLTANKLMADTRLPLDWRAQRAALGFADWVHRRSCSRLEEMRGVEPAATQSETQVPPKSDFET